MFMSPKRRFFKKRLDQVDFALDKQAEWRSSVFLLSFLTVIPKNRRSCHVSRSQRKLELEFCFFNGSDRIGCRTWALVEIPYTVGQHGVVLYFVLCALPRARRASPLVAELLIDSWVRDCQLWTV